jgi:N-acetyl-gamma-glutamyl-phosphate reductase
LCLPDAAAGEAVAMLDGTKTRVIDTSSARRTDPDWVYGLPELGHGQREAIVGSHRVANPGCYPQTVILALRPLIDAGVVDATCAFTVNAVSGYSGGGRQLIETHQSLATNADGDAAMPLYLYALNDAHKHLPEMHLYSGAAAPPLFVPSVDHRYCGMLVSVPLPARWLQGRGNGPNKDLGRDEIVSIWRERYDGEALTRVLSLRESDAQLRDGRNLALPDESIGNRLELSVYGSAERGLVLIGRLDNLGKGAAGNAVQCMNLMLGFEESQGLLPVTSAAA